MPGSRQIILMEDHSLSSMGIIGFEAVWGPFDCVVKVRSSGLRILYSSSVKGRPRNGSFRIECKCKSLDLGQESCSWVTQRGLRLALGVTLDLN